MLPRHVEEGFEDLVGPGLRDWNGADIRLLGLVSLDKEIGP